MEQYKMQNNKWAEQDYYKKCSREELEERYLQLKEELQKEFQFNVWANENVRERINELEEQIARHQYY
jgi:uncharacterized damage-inducible protein DinB